ncbi:MAG TPA: hypothetical protein VFX33_08040 [Actinomycetales bacterium]|nr:hypothetical protein [Actinomycetales bacterium]
MSASTAPARAPRVGQSRRRPRLQVVTPPPTSRSRGPFILGCTALLVVSLLGLLVLNISLSRGAYEVHDLQARATALTEREQQISEELASRAAPARLAQDARKLGMVPAGAPAFIRLSDGKVLGKPEPAPSATAPSVLVGAPPKPKPTTQPTAKATPAAPTTPTAQEGQNAARPSEPKAPASSQHAQHQSPPTLPEPKPVQPGVRAATGDGAVPVTETAGGAGD